MTYIGHIGACLAIPVAFIIFWCLPYHFLVKGVMQQVTTKYSESSECNKYLLSSEKPQEVFALACNALPSLHPCLCQPLPSRHCQEGEFKTNLYYLCRPSSSTTADCPWDSSCLLVRPLLDRALLNLNNNDIHVQVGKE